MNAVSPITPDANTTIWQALSKTDPAHTKQFSRAGGFKGTALKPMWIVKRLTEQFGPVGLGWGMGEPHFQVERADGETLVYCTVRCWHTNEGHGFYGVGGDKVTTKRQNGAFNDDEAFKKAFTDAVGNAFKFLGVGADIHMGQFDDSKYVQQVAAEFAEGQSQQGAVSPPQPTIAGQDLAKLEQLIPAAGLTPARFNQTFGIAKVSDLPAERMGEAVERLEARMAELVKFETNKEAANA